MAGSDSNAGNTREAPFKTIDKAMASTPNSGSCQINLLSDYTLNYQVVSSCAYVYIYGGILSTAPKLKVQYYQQTDTNQVVQTMLGGFLMSTQYSQIEIRQVEIVLPSSVGVSPVPSNMRFCSLIRTNAGSNLPPLLGVSLETLAITMDASFIGWLIGSSTTPVSLNANSVTFPSGFGGKYVNGVAAGTDPKTLNYLITNLTAL